MPARTAVWRAPITLGVLLALLVGASGTTARSATPARLDAWGDPLPPGALFRIGTLRAHPDVSYGARFSPDCKTITADGPDDTIRLLDAATGKDIRVFGDRAHRRISYWHSSDGKSLFTVGHDRTFRVCEVASGKERR